MQEHGIHLRKDRGKTGLGVRGDCLYCPLSFSLDTYWNCLSDCHHCNFRRLNKVWGEDLRPRNPEAIRKKLVNGLRNTSPKSTLANVLAQKKTCRIGSKSDPFQEAERDHRVTQAVLEIFHELEWSYVLQTRHTDIVMEYEELIVTHRDSEGSLATVMPVISPGWEEDWERLERKRTTHPDDRLAHIVHLQEKGVNVGVNGEPFIPGYHTLDQFETTVRRLKAAGIASYNTYNLHLNEDNLKKMVDIGIDMERVWEMNQDGPWKEILQEMILISKEVGIRLGSPDFVNSGSGYREQANTCCGVNVPNPSRFNSHHWKRMLQDGEDPAAILAETWEGIGKEEDGRKIVEGTTSDFYTMKDAGVVGLPEKKPKEGLLY